MSLLHTVKRRLNYACMRVVDTMCIVNFELFMCSLLYINDLINVGVEFLTHVH